MTAQQIEVLSNLLSNNNSITEVSVNGNPNEEQNFHLLLQDKQIIYLSLRFCGITAMGIEKISNELSNPFDSCLLHLNLSSNSICDDGIYYVVHFLRINRTLISLNLADNKIYDEGCFTLVQSLQKFELKLEEIIVRRRIRFSLLQKLQTQAETSNDEIDPPIRNERISVKERKSNSPEDFAVASKKSTSASIVKRDIGNHPFVENSYEEDKAIYCKGNNTLVNLNLSYNRITKEGLNCLIQMLTYQRHMFAHDKGISRISIEGNDFNNCEQELQELERELLKKSRSSQESCSTISLTSKSKSRSQSSLKKKSSRVSLI